MSHVRFSLPNIHANRQRYERGKVVYIFNSLHYVKR